MKKYILFVFYFVILHSFVGFSQITDQINSNRPGQSISAYAVGKSVLQTEMGFFGIDEQHELINYHSQGGGTDLSIRYGAFKEELEFNLEMQYQMDHYTDFFVDTQRKGFRKMGFGAKYLIYDPFKKTLDKKPNFYSWKANHRVSYRALIPSVGLYIGANLNLLKNPYTFESDPVASPKIVAVAQHQLGKSVLVTNLIADKIGTEFPSYGYVITLTHALSEKWSIFAENQYYRSNFYSDLIIRGGGAFLLTDDMQVDINIGKNFKNTPSLVYGGVGFSWRYDANYKEVRIYKKGKDKKKGKGKKK